MVKSEQLVRADAENAKGKENHEDIAKLYGMDISPIYFIQIPLNLL